MHSCIEWQFEIKMCLKSDIHVYINITRVDVYTILKVLELANTSMSVFRHIFISNCHSKQECIMGVNPHCPQHFSYNVVATFYGGRNRSSQNKNLICCISLTNCSTWSCIMHTSGKRSRMPIDRRWLARTRRSPSHIWKCSLHLYLTCYRDTKDVRSVNFNFEQGVLLNVDSVIILVAQVRFVLFLGTEGLFSKYNLPERWLLLQIKFGRLSILVLSKQF
jgi:hypothetical protein